MRTAYAARDTARSRLSSAIKAHDPDVSSLKALVSYLEVQASADMIYCALITTDNQARCGPFVDKRHEQTVIGIEDGRLVAVPRATISAGSRTATSSVALSQPEALFPGQQPVSRQEAGVDGIQHPPTIVLPRSLPSLQLAPQSLTLVLPDHTTRLTSSSSQVYTWPAGAEHSSAKPLITVTTTFETTLPTVYARSPEAQMTPLATKATISAGHLHACDHDCASKSVLQQADYVLEPTQSGPTAERTHSADGTSLALSQCRALRFFGETAINSV